MKNKKTKKVTATGKKKRKKRDIMWSIMNREKSYERERESNQLRRVRKRRTRSRQM